jgi:hypothetical protein
MSQDDIDTQAKNIQLALLLTANVLQRYMAYLDESPVESLFKKDDIFQINDSSYIEFKKDNKIYKLKLDLVDKNYMFELGELNSKQVLDSMSKMVQSSVIVYNMLKCSIQNTKSDIFKHDTILSVDPVNTTIVINSPVHGEMISKQDKRIGFVWHSIDQ